MSSNQNPQHKRESTLAEQITAAASVVTAAAAAKTAVEATKVRKEIEASNKAAQIASERQERIQIAMAFEQEENHFRTNILAALRLLKSQEEKTEFLTDQFVPVLRANANTEILLPLDYVTQYCPIGDDADDEYEGISPIEKYLGFTNRFGSMSSTETEKELASLKNEGKSLILRQKLLGERKASLIQLEAKRQQLVNTPAGAMEIIKSVIWIVFCFEVFDGSFGTNVLQVLGIWQKPQDDVVRIIFSWSAAFLIGIFVQTLLWRRKRRRKLNKVKVEIGSLTATDNSPATAAEGQALERFHKSCSVSGA
jgi:hypothetical protein